MTRPLSLAAGSVLDAGSRGTLRAAAGAGYDAAGLRPAPDETGRADAASLRVLADDLGLAVLDLEVVRLGPDACLADHLRLLEVAQILGARYLLTVSSHPDRTATTDELGRLSAASAGGPTRVVLEFMRFTRVGTLTEAVEIATAADAVVLVDALHLARSGGTPADLAAVAPERIGYLQICDAPAVAGPWPLAEEARHRRLPPGQGDLPLAALLEHAPPDVPVSVEVQSDRLAAELPPGERARTLLEAARRTLRGTRADPA
jgi:sugar phosphate isomerase/epimerase